MIQIGKNSALIMEGGGMRGLFTAGVIDVFMEQGITFPCAIGVSAGACFGVNIKSRQIGRALRYNVQLAGDPRYMGLRSLLRTGDYVNGEFAYHVVPHEIDVFDTEEYARNPMQFYVVCTDVESGEPVYHRVDHIVYTELEWIRASASLPMISRPVSLEGRGLLDGGISDSIPLRFAESLGYDHNVVILTQPLGYRKRPASHPWLFDLYCRRYPKMAELLRRRHLMYNAELEYVEQQARLGRCTIIAPKEPLNIGRVSQDKKEIMRVYEEGRRAANTLRTLPNPKRDGRTLPPAPPQGRGVV